MLSLKNGVSFHRSLLAVIEDFGRGKPFANKILCVAADNSHALVLNIFHIGFVKLKARAKF